VGSSRDCHSVCRRQSDGLGHGHVGFGFCDVGFGAVGSRGFCAGPRQEVILKPPGRAIDRPGRVSQSNGTLAVPFLHPASL
jgi:hypothetical protein